MSEQSGSNESNDMIMSLNGLKFSIPQTLSTTVNRTFRREYAQRNSYNSGQTMVFDLNTGTAYVDPSNAMLSFDVTVSFGTGQADNEVVNFGTGCGATTLIEEIRLISKNGTELDRIQDSAVLSKIMSDWTYDAQGNDYLGMALKDGAIDLAVSDTARAVIPLSLICGFFRPVVKDMMIPAGLASGMRIEITLANAARALTKASGTGTVIDYTITNPTMLLMLHDLNDPTQAVLMQQSASNGLEYSFPSYFSTKVTTTQTSINEQVKKAVSFATRAFATVFDVSGADSVLLEAKDGFETIESSLLTNFQYRVGSQYYPQNPIDDPSESWYVTSAAFNKNRDTQAPSSVSYADYVTGTKFLLGVPLQTHDKLNLSGLSINNSSVLELRLNVTNAGALSRQVVIFMEYITVARTFINKSDIKI